jgi:hypothetical protein
MTEIEELREENERLRNRLHNIHLGRDPNYNVTPEWRIVGPDGAIKREGAPVQWQTKITLNEPAPPAEPEKPYNPFDPKNWGV